MTALQDDSFESYARFLRRANELRYGTVYKPPPLTLARRLTDRQNPLEYYDEGDFLARYRFSKRAVTAILAELQLHCNTDNRGAPLPALLMVLIALRFYGTGSMQTVVGDLVCVSQPSVCRCIWEVTQLICRRLYPKYVRLPNASEARLVMTRFYSIGGFPGVTGCIDCTHIPIKSPGGDDAEVFRNRKGVFSINVQVVSGPELQFFDVVASWPGSVHDSRIFTNSRVSVMYEQKAVTGILLGDQGYACSPYLMTPLRNPQTTAEKRYNRSQIRTRNSIERAFGLWKRRFACLRTKLETLTELTVAIITACAALHNIACTLREPNPNVDEPEPEGEGVALCEPDSPLGTQHRRYLIQRCFTSAQSEDDSDMDTV
nr:putative nuclease HARBI1 [Dermacentor andersoni]